MSGTTSYAAKQPKQGNGGEQWTEEQRNAFQAQWDNFAKKMAKRKAGQTRDFDAVCIYIGDAAPVTKEFKGEKSTTIRRDIKFELREAGLDMLRWQESSADNPFNDKTILHQLIVAVTGVVPRQEDGLTINFEDLLNKKVRVTIERQNNRKEGEENVRGGFYSKLRGVSPIFDDDDEEEAPAPPPTKKPTPLPKAALTPPKDAKKVAANPTPATPVESDDEPWEDED